MTAIDEIKTRIDIVDLVSESVKLRRAGKNYTGFCPFHPNSRTPAFVVFPDSGTWRCFGQCNEGGDIFRFVMKKEGWDFPQTLQYLAQKAGVVLEAQTPEKEVEDAHLERLHALLEDAVTFYRHHLLSTQAGEQALAYLKKRGLTPLTIEQFALGYAPDSWDAASQYFQGKGYSPAELLEVGVATERQNASGFYDRFRNRIMFPIRDAMGRMTGFGARILNPDDVPKFLNSPQTPLFDKGHLLYGLDLARKAIRANNQVVIVEGYLDVIALHQSGFSNTVSPMGTALTEDQFRLLKRFTRRMVLALDPDAAGEKATLRGLDVARQTLDRSDEMAFDARGLLRHEARLQADLRVTTLPPGKDPDEVALNDPQDWKKILEAAKPIVLHVMDTLLASGNAEDPKQKSQIVSQMLPLIEDVPDPVERDDYRQRLARALRLDERSLVGTGLPARRPRRQAAREEERVRKTVISASPGRLALDLEAHSLRLLLRQPEAVNLVDRALQKSELNRLSLQDYEQTDHQMLLKLIQESLEQDEMEPHHFITEKMPGEIRELTDHLLKKMEHGEPSEENLVDDLVRTVLRLRRERISESLGQLRYIQEDIQSQEDLRQLSYQEMIGQYIQLLLKLDRALNRSSFQLD